MKILRLGAAFLILLNLSNVCHAARQFNGTNQALKSASTLSLSSYNTLTIAWWMWWDNFADDDMLAMEYSADFNSTANTWLIDPNSSSVGNTFEVSVSNGAGAYDNKHFTRPSAGAWHHYAVTMDLSKNETTGNYKVQNVYLDGAPASLSNDAINFTATGNTFANQTLNIMSRNGASLWAAGRFCELAIWSGNLSGATIADMYNGGTSGHGKSALYYPTNLRYYWKIGGTSSPEPENGGGPSLTLVGTPTNVAGPTIDYPAATKMLRRLIIQ